MEAPPEGLKVLMLLPDQLLGMNEERLLHSDSTAGGKALRAKHKRPAHLFTRPLEPAPEPEPSPSAPSPEAFSFGVMTANLPPEVCTQTCRRSQSASGALAPNSITCTWMLSPLLRSRPSRAGPCISKRLLGEFAQKWENWVA